MGGDYLSGDDSEDEYASGWPPSKPTLQLLQKISAKQDFLLDEFTVMQNRRRKFWKKRKLCKFIKFLIVIGAFLWLKHSFTNKSLDTCEHTKMTKASPIPVSVSRNVWMAANLDTPAVLMPDSKWTHLLSNEPVSVVEVDAHGDIWVVPKHQPQVYRYTNARMAEVFQVGASLSNFATYDGQRIFYTCNRCEKVDMEDSRTWVQLDADLKQISVGDGDTVWGVDKDNKIWTYDINGKNKKSISGRLNYISVASDKIIYGINMDGNVVKWDSQNWIEINGGMKAMRVKVTTDDVFVLLRSDTYTWYRVSLPFTKIMSQQFPFELIVRRRTVKQTTPRRSTRIINEEIPTPPPPPPPKTVDTPPKPRSTSNHVAVYSKLTGTNHYDIFLEKFGQTELLVTFPSSLRHVSVSNDFVTMVLGKKVYFQSWADQQHALTSNRMYDDEVGAFLTKKRSWFLERRVLTVDTAGQCFVEGTCDYYDEKRNSPTFHSYRFNTMDVSHDGSVAWGLTADDSIFEWDSALKWTKRSGKLVQISVGSANHVWGINRRGLIFEYVGRDNWRHVAWNVRHGKPSAVRVGKNGHVVLLTKEGNVYQYDRSGNKWIHLSEYKDIQHMYLL